ncbi:MAG: extracellular solute-binding protein [Phycisphaerales bacterium]|nr:extracellular solute-binding protein [Phycisphaerales bacterium]
MRWLIACVLLLVAAIAPGCSESNQQDDGEDSVVLYTSADDHLAKLVADAFTKETGIRVQILGDTEATKTTGLVARILAESDHPKGDVWWSSEPMGTIHLAASGALERGGMAGTVPEDWPSELIGRDGTWVGFAQRARVIVYAADRVREPPTTMRALVDPEWKGRIGMARPQFGTTRGHMAVLRERWGSGSFQVWLDGLKKNKLRLYDGNMSVVRAVSLGEIDVGLTDTDDVFAGKENGWGVELVYESIDDDPAMPSFGATTIPNTVGIIAGAPNPEGARKLAAFLVSPACERLIAQSASRNTPVHSSLRDEFSDLAMDPGGVLIDYARAYPVVGDAMDACERTLEGP